MKGGIMAALQGCTHVISCTSTPCHMNETALLIKIIISLTKNPHNSSKVKIVKTVQKSKQFFKSLVNVILQTKC